MLSQPPVRSHERKLPSAGRGTPARPPVRVTDVTIAMDVEPGLHARQREMPFVRLRPSDCTRTEGLLI
jgi:hypothetical protein